MKQPHVSASDSARLDLFCVPVPNKSARLARQRQAGLICFRRVSVVGGDDLSMGVFARRLRVLSVCCRGGRVFGMERHPACGTCVGSEVAAVRQVQW